MCKSQPISIQLSKVDEASMKNELELLVHFGISYLITSLPWEVLFDQCPGADTHHETHGTIHASDCHILAKLNSSS